MRQTFQQRANGLIVWDRPEIFFSASPDFDRMPVLRQREQRLRAELQAMIDQSNDRAMFLLLAETLTAFLARLRRAAETLSITERQQIVRLIVKEVLIGDDSITIRHSTLIPSGPSQNDGGPSPKENYLLCKGSDHTALRDALFARCRQHQLQQTHHLIIFDPACNFLKQQMMSDRIEICT